MAKKQIEKVKHYRLNSIMKIKSHYKLIYGERSNGKTFAVEELGLFGFHEDGIDYNGYLDDGSQLAIIRRWDTDLKGKKGNDVFDHFIHNNEEGNIIKKRTKGKWNSVYYQSMRWYLQRLDEDGEVEERDPTPFAIGFALNTEEHEKSLSYPRIGTILFDEFIARNVCLSGTWSAGSTTIECILTWNTDCVNVITSNAVFFKQLSK